MTSKIRIKKWKPMYAALAAGQEFETQKGMKEVAPTMDHNLPMILIRLGYITPHPPYKLAKKIWDWNKIDSRLRAYYKERKSGNSLQSKELAASTLTENLIWNEKKPSDEWKMPTLEETKEKIMAKRAEELKKFWDADLVSELRRRGYEVTAKKTVEL